MRGRQRQTLAAIVGFGGLIVSVVIDAATGNTAVAFALGLAAIIAAAFLYASSGRS